jgi:hypothetical protein
MSAYNTFFWYLCAPRSVINKLFIHAQRVIDFNKLFILEKSFTCGCCKQFSKHPELRKFEVECVYNAVCLNCYIDSVMNGVGKWITVKNTACLIIKYNAIGGDNQYDRCINCSQRTSKLQCVEMVRTYGQSHSHHMCCKKCADTFEKYIK